MKTFFDLSPAEQTKKSQLTPAEKSAVDALFSAAKALPKTLCIEVDDDWNTPGYLKVHKRIAPNTCIEVATLRKKSLRYP